MSSGEAEKTEITWWQGLIVGFFLLAIALANIVYRGGVQDPFTGGMLLLGAFAFYVIYDAIEDYRSHSKEVGGESPSSKGDTNGKLAPFVERLEARSQSTIAVIYTWFTVGFAVIFSLPSTEWWVPVRLLVLTLAGGVIWVRTGGEGPAETSNERMKRFGAGVAGVLSGLVIALSVRWLLVQVL